MGGGGSKCNKCCQYRYISSSAATRSCNWENKCTDQWGWGGAATRDCSWEDKCTDMWGWKTDPCPAGLTDRGAFCDRQAHSIAMSYVPESKANTDRYNPSTVVKPSNTRDSDLPSCPPCEKEYGWVLGTCYEDCNITAGISTCETDANGKKYVKRKPGFSDKLNYSMQSTGLCNLDCPSGTTDMGTYCALPPVTRGAGTPLECSGRWQQYGAQCYTPCNETAGISTWNGTAQVKKAGYEYVNYQMQSAGLCSQQCPDGTTDGGVFCNRQKYYRGVGKVKKKPGQV
jgi:hypothetical protein